MKRKIDFFPRTFDVKLISPGISLEVEILGNNQELLFHPLSLLFLPITPHSWSALVPIIPHSRFWLVSSTLL